VCVLEVLHPKKATQASSSTSGGVLPSTAASGQQDSKSTTTQAKGASAAAPPKKRQRSMLDFASAAETLQPSPSAAEPAPAPATSRMSGALRGMDRRYLLVQRAEGSGLLAGLWEFPGNHWERLSCVYNSLSPVCRT